MDKVADFIESWIIGRLRSTGNNVVIVRRNELAEELECAPSQVSYVLSTRFTVERGYLVESRRGSGGFVRIVRVPFSGDVFEDATRQIGRNTSREAFHETVLKLKENGFLTERESALFSQFYEMMAERVDPSEQVGILRRLLLTLANRRD